MSGSSFTLRSFSSMWKDAPQNKLEITRDNLFEQPPDVLQRAAVVLAALGSDASADNTSIYSYTQLHMGAKDIKLFALYAMCGGMGDEFTVDVRLVCQKAADG
jgi:hypothetical protein